MRKIHFKKDVLPHILAVALFLALTLFFFRPAFFDGQSLSQGDIEQWSASATELIDYRNETGQEGLWTNSIFGGMPAYMISVQWGNQLIKFTHAVYTLGLPHPARILFASMLSFYIMLLCFKVRPYLAILGAIAFGCSSYNLIGFTAGHNARISAVSFMPLVIGAIHLCLTRNKWLGGSLTALALAMQLRVNHIQMTYYLVFVIVIYGIIQLIYHYRAGKIKFFLQRSAILICAVILAIGTYFGEFYATYEYGKYSNRGKSELTQQTDDEKNQDGLSKSYAFRYSNGIWDPFTLFIPNALGGSASLGPDSNIAEGLRKAGATEAQVRQQLPSINGLLYWGKETATTYYAGAIMVFLFAVGVAFVDKKYVIWLIAVTILGIVLSYGRNMESINYLLFDYLPGYNKFRSVTFTMALPIFAISLLGMLGLEKLLEQKLDKTTKKKLLIALGSTAGLALLLAIFAGAFGFRGIADNPQWPDWLKGGIIEDRKSAFRIDAFRSFIFIVLFAGVYYLHAISKISKSIAFSLFALLVILDISLMGGRFMNESRFLNTSEQSAQMLPGDQFIQQNKNLGDRVIDLGPNIFYDARASRFNHSINGYHGARIRRFQELLDAKLQDERFQMRQDFQSGALNFENYEIVNMLNGRFVMANPTSPQGIVVNNEANGAAWFVSDIKLVSSPDEELAQTQIINTNETAVIDQSKFSGIKNSYQNNGTIELTEYNPGYWKYESNNSGDGFAVFSEIHYPKGFKVTIDGQEVDMLRANYILRALEIPAGKHMIEFRFVPKIYTAGSAVMQVFSILTLLLFLISLYLTVKKP